MGKQKKALPTVGIALYGIGGLSAITEVVFLLLFLPWFSPVNNIALLIGAFIGIALPALIMPLCYSVINGNTAIATGRYHLFMAVSALVGALTYVCLLGVDKAPAAAQGFAVFGLTFAYSLSIQVFLYSSVAVGRRFDPSGFALKLRSIFTLLSALIGALIIIWIMDSSRDSIRAIVSVAAIFLIVGAFITYMATVVQMPSFVRMEPKHKRSIKDCYARFLKPLKNKIARPLIISAFFVCAGAGFAAATIPSCVFSYAYDISTGYKIAMIIATFTLALSGSLCTYVIKRCGRKGGAITSVSVLAVLMCVTVLTVIFTFLPIKSAQNGLMFAYAAVCGISLGASFAYENHNKNFVAEIAECSAGRYYCFRNCVAALGLSVGVISACVANIVKSYSAKSCLVVVYSVYAVFITVGILLNYLNLKHEQVLTQREEM